MPVPFPTVSEAYAAARVGETTIISIGAGLYLDPSPRFEETKRVRFEPRGGRIVLTSTDRPSNDSPTNAALILGTSGVFAYNYAATNDTFDAALHYFGITNFTKSLWWMWVAPTNGQVLFNVVAQGFTPLLDVFGEIGGLPVTLPESRFYWRETATYESETSLEVLPGDRYFLRVAALDQGYGGVTVYATMADPPPNDFRTNAIVLIGNRTRVFGKTFGATAEPEPDEPRHANIGAGRTVWYRWTAPTNTGQPRHPLTLTTAGSDFSTVLAVYTNGSDGLGLVAASVDRIRTNHYNAVVFEPVSGTTYYIAIDGVDRERTGVPDRKFVGNYSLQLDYSWINLTVSPDPMNPLERFADGSVRERANFGIKHYGLVPIAGPLRLRVVGRTGNSISGIHLQGAAGQTNLLTEAVPASSAIPNGAASLPVEYIRPPNFRPAPDKPENFWGVYGILEEQNGTNWFFLDSVFVGFGSDIPASGSGGLHFGLGRRYEEFRESEASVDDVEGIYLAGPDSGYATDHSTADIVVFALLADGKSRAIRPFRWIVPAGFSLVTRDSIAVSDGVPATNALGLLTIGDLPTNTNLLLNAVATIGPFEYRSENNTFANYILRLPVYKRPSVVIHGVGPPRTLILTPPAPGLYRIEATTALDGSNTVWQTLATNQFGPGPVGRTFITPTKGPRQQFFRAERLP